MRGYERILKGRAAGQGGGKPRPYHTRPGKPTHPCMVGATLAPALGTVALGTVTLGTVTRVAVGLYLIIYAIFSI